MSKYAALDDFLEKYQTAKNYNSKEIRLTVQEAEQLSTAIGRILVKITELGDTVIELQKEIAQQPVEITVSGGAFTSS